MSERAELPRSTITHLESGNGNPTLENIARVSRALSVSIEKLLARPPSEAVLLRARSVPLVKRASYEVLDLLPEKMRGQAFERIELKPKAKFLLKAQLADSKDYFYILQGAVSFHFAEEVLEVRKGDCLSVPGDREKKLQNQASTKSIFIRITHTY